MQIDDDKKKATSPMSIMLQTYSDYSDDDTIECNNDNDDNDVDHAHDGSNKK